MEYSDNVLQSNTFRLEKLGTPTPFDTRNLETIVDEIDYGGKATFRVLIAQNGTVKDYKIVSSKLTEEDNANLIKEIRDTNWLPFIGSEYGISTIDFVTGMKDAEGKGKGWVYPLWPRPTKKNEF